MMRRARRPQTAWDKLITHLVGRGRKSVAATHWEGLEPLEDRLMLSAQIGVSGGVLSTDTSGNITSAATVIPAGDTTPNQTDHTDAGDVTLDPAAAQPTSTSWTFVIQNTGDASLVLGSTTPTINVTGTNEADFTIDTSQSTATVAAGASTSFTVNFTPTEVGIETATVSILSNDPTTPLFQFAVQGTGAAKPLTGATEDLDFQISYATLNADIQQGATPPTPVYQIQTIDTGTLTVNGAAAVAGTTLINPGDSLVWHPAANANRTLNAFTLKTWNGTQAVGDPIPIRVEVAEVNDPPTGTIPNSVAQVGDAPTVLDLTQMFTDPDVTGPIVQFNTVEGPIDVSLFGTLTPATVSNFMNYVTSGSYNDTFIHRVAPGFVVQGGGYQATASTPHIATAPAVVNEFHDSSLVGTIAMAKVGNNPNSATSEWFFNLGDNSDNLDNQNGGFTVFGEVVGNGMSVVNTIAGLPTGTINSLSTVPEINSSSSTVAAQNLVTITSAGVISPLTYAIAGNTNSALVTPSLTNGQLTLAYSAGMSGIANITIRVTDLGGNSINVPFTVRVNAKPIAAAYSAVTPLNAAVPIDLVDSPTTDSDGTVVKSSVQIVTGPLHGTLSLDPATGTETYRPTTGYFGPDSFTYTVTDNDGGVSAPGTVSIRVNQPPTVADDTAFAQAGHPVTISVLANDKTNNNGKLVLNSVTVVPGVGQAHGTATANPDGTITYTPGPDFLDGDTFQYTVSDDTGDISSPATVTISAESLVVDIGTGHAKSLTFTDADGTTTTITMTSGVAELSFAGAPNLATTPSGSTLKVTGGPAQLVDVTLTETTAAGALAFSSNKSGTPGITVNSITSATGLKSITGPLVTLTGSLSVDGDLTTLALGDTTQATINVMGTDASASLTATLGDATNLQFNSGIKIKSLTAASITGGLSEITAPVLAAVKVNGEFDANLTLPGMAGVATTLGPVTATGTLNGGTWHVTGNASTITAASAAATWSAIVSGDVGAIKFTGDLAGSLQARSLKSLTTGGNLNGFNLTLAGGGPATTLGAVSVKDEIEGGSWTIIGNGSTVTAGSLVLTSSNAAWVASLTGGLTTVKITGDATGTLTAQSITSMSVGGSLHDATITLTRDLLMPKLLALGSLTVKGLADHVDLSSNGNIGTLTLAAAQDSSFFAGVQTGPNILPTASGNFPVQATIQTIKFTGLSSQPFELVDTNIAAWILGSFTAKFAEPNTGEGASGLAANTIKSLTYTDTDANGVTSTAKLNAAQLAGKTSVDNLILNLVSDA